MFEFLLHLVVVTGDWLAANVAAPMMTMLLDHPWVGGLVLVAAVAVAVIDTRRSDTGGQR
jgi:hypothetical protein